MIIYKPQGTRKEVVSTSNMQKERCGGRSKRKGRGKKIILSNFYPIVVFKKKLSYLYGTIR